VTFVYVTHDQGEALTMSDRVAVFNEGEIQQLDSVDQLYEAPVNRFVAGFVGDSTVLQGQMGAGNSQRSTLVLPGGQHLDGVNVNHVLPGHPVLASIRPERVEAHFAAPADLHNVLEAAVNDVIYFGDHLRLRCALAGQAPATVKLPLSRGAAPQPGQPVWLRFPPEYLRLYS
jgi:putative spermidine/putrescine transport system ATP-binding protein